MSNGFNVGGAPMQLVRDLGTPGAVQGFRTAEPTQGPRLAAALATTFRQFAQDGSAQLRLIVTVGSVVWANVAGVWKQGIWWAKDAGVWKISEIKAKVAGVWK